MMISRTPLLIPVLSLIAGITIQSCGGGMSVALSFFVVGVCGWMILLHMSRNPAKSYSLNKYYPIFIAFIFAATGMFDAMIFRTTPIDDLSLGKINVIKGRIEKKSYSTSGDKLLISLMAYNSPDNRNWIVADDSKLLLQTDAVSAKPGDIIVATTELRRIEDPKNIYLPGYADKMFHRNILYSAKTSGENITITGESFSLLSSAEKCRDHLEIAIEKAGFSQPLTKFLISIMLGDRDYLDPELHEDFADAGIAHILALSGMHIALIASFFLWLLFPLNFTGNYKIRLITVILIMWCYTFVSGMAPSTVRAALMLSFFKLSRILERKYNSLNALLCAILIILLADTDSLFDIGFQLSAVCVASLILFIPKINPIDHLHHPRLHNFMAIILSTIVATSASWMITAYYFSSIPTLFIPANLIALPLLPFFLALSALQIVLSALSLHIPFLAQFLNFLFTIFTEIISTLANACGDSALHLSLNPTAPLLWIVGLFTTGASFYLPKRKILVYTGSILMIASIVSIPLLTGQSNPEGFIVQSRFDRISILHYHSFSSNTITGMPQTTSMHTLSENRIIIANSNIENPETLPICDYLIISRSCKGDFAQIIKSLKPKTVIIHSSIHKKKEEEIIIICNEIGIPFHSIRKSGPFRKIESL